MLPRNHNIGHNVNHNSEVKRVADQITILKGQRPMLRDFLVQSLQLSGWDDKVRLMCREEIKMNGNISAEEIINRVTPRARKEIPDDVKAEMVAKIKSVLLENCENL